MDNMNGNRTTCASDRVGQITNKMIRTIDHGLLANPGSWIVDEKTVWFMVREITDHDSPQKNDSDSFLRISFPFFFLSPLNFRN